MRRIGEQRRGRRLPGIVVGSVHGLVADHDLRVDEFGPDDHPLPVLVQRGAKGVVALKGVGKHHVENHQLRPGGRQPVEHEGVNLARPIPVALAQADELERRRGFDLLGPQGVQLHRRIVDAEKDEVGPRGGGAAVLAQEIAGRHLPAV